ncbi:MAG: hypothetical protein DRP09_08745 [Candidatus Thorarchaeota archaeon]|nr:MAG: hypothetical protein DRP09_08745 [Candidatus Thorarchaeota archaeon]
MSFKYPPSAFSRLLEQFELDLNLSDEQAAFMEEGVEFSLSEDQMDDVVRQIASVIEPRVFLEEYAETVTPIRMSLYVLNDDLWAMMQRKPWEDDRGRMLAMTTIPLCTWEHSEERVSNPKGAKRWEVKPNKMRVSWKRGRTLSITGEGGDFAGFIERSHRTARKWSMPESRQLIPNYEFVTIFLQLTLDGARVTTRPLPRDELDYDFSESGKFFYDHGVMLEMPGENVLLKSGKRRPYRMKGNAVILLGLHDPEDAYRDLLASLWFRILAREVGGV